ncbi:hypothetical protein EI555_017967, partial [Monodon monoceros]
KQAIYDHITSGLSLCRVVSRDLQTFKQRVKSMNFIGQGTFSYYAIANVTRLLKREGCKDGVKVALLMTDGIDHPKNPDVQSISEDARTSGILFITIGLSTLVNETKLRLVSGDPSSEPILLLNDSTLVDKIQDHLVGKTEGKAIRTKALFTTFLKEETPGDKDILFEKKGTHGNPGIKDCMVKMSMVKGIPGYKSEKGKEARKEELGLQDRLVLVLQDVTNFEYLKGEFHDKYELLGNKNLCSSMGSQGSQEYREKKELQGRVMEERKGAKEIKDRGDFQGPKDRRVLEDYQDPLDQGFYIERETLKQRVILGRKACLALLAPTGYGLQGIKVTPCSKSLLSETMGLQGPRGDRGLTKEEIIKLIFEICGCGRKCREAPLELLFLRKCGTGELPDYQNFVKTLTDRVALDLATAHVGIINYGHKVEEVDHLTQFSSKDDLKQAVDNMQYLGEGTYTATALHAANRMFEAARLGVKKVALVITDEQTDRRDEKNLTEVVKDASDIDVEIFVIGVVKRNDPNFKMFHKEMNLIATDPDNPRYLELYSQETVANMWFDGIMTNRSTPVLAFGSVAVKAHEIDSTVKRNVKKSAFKDEQ